MKYLLAILLSIALIPVNGQTIIADHTIVDEYANIPDNWIDSVKTMFLSYAGESHSEGIRVGLAALETSEAKYAVNVTESGTPESYTTDHLRASRAMWGDLNNTTGWIYNYGEEDWFTSATAIDRTKAGITYANTNDLTFSALGFGWCWDIGVDFQDYIDATQEYIDYCSDSIETTVFFTTGTVDIYDGEDGWVKHQGYELIRSYVETNGGVLFDYADILCYDDDGLNTETWEGNTYPFIAYDNLNPLVSSYHISEEGTVRLAKAMWWMLARIAGWDGNASTPVDPPTATGKGKFGRSGGKTLMYNGKRMIIVTDN